MLEFLKPFLPVRQIANSIMSDSEDLRLTEYTSSINVQNGLFFIFFCT